MAQAEAAKESREALLAERENVQTLNAKISVLNNPKRAAADEARYQAVNVLLTKYGNEEKTILRHLRIHGKMIEHPMLGIYPIPNGFNRDQTRSILSRFENDQIVTPEHHQISSGFEYTWQIAPGMAGALDELLYQANNSVTAHT